MTTLLTDPKYRTKIPDDYQEANFELVSGDMNDFYELVRKYSLDELEYVHEDTDDGRLILHHTSGATINIEKDFFVTIYGRRNAIEEAVSTLELVTERELREIKDIGLNLKL